MITILSIPYVQTARSLWSPRVAVTVNFVMKFVRKLMFAKISGFVCRLGKPKVYISFLHHWLLERTNYFSYTLCVPLCVPSMQLTNDCSFHFLKLLLNKKLGILKQVRTNASDKTNFSALQHLVCKNTDQRKCTS